MTRLIRLAGRSRNDPELFAGLVLACRYAGLHDASVAAHHEARRLDPHVATSIVYTHMVAAEYDDAVRELDDTYGAQARLQALFLAGRMEEAREHVGSLSGRGSVSVSLRAYHEGMRAIINDDREAAIQRIEEAVASMPDPEAQYLFALNLARLGRPQRALTILKPVSRFRLRPAHGFFPGFGIPEPSNGRGLRGPALGRGVGAPGQRPRLPRCRRPGAPRSEPRPGLTRRGRRYSLRLRFSLTASPSRTLTFAATGSSLSWTASIS